MALVADHAARAVRGAVADGDRRAANGGDARLVRAEPPPNLDKGAGQAGRDRVGVAAEGHQGRRAASDGAFSDGPVRLPQLDRAPMVAWPLTCDQPLMEQALTRSGNRPRIAFRSAINDTLLSMVRAGMGSAVLPWLAIRGADVQSDHRLSVHELRPSLPAQEIYLHWRAGRTRSPLAARVIEIAVEVAAEIAAHPDKASPRHAAVRRR